MILEQPTILTAPNKKPILMDTSFEGEKKEKPVVIFCHGYKGFKDWGAWHLVAKMFAKAGFCFVKFNFSHNGGTPENPLDFPDLDAFANNNFTTELDDLDRVLNFLNTSEVSLIGHSRGAGIVLIKAEEDSRVQKVVTWAGVSDFKARFQIESEAFAQWKKTGITYVENARTKQQLPHYWQFFEDFLAHETRLTIRRAVENLKKPQLIVHGTADPTVSMEEALALHRWNPNSQLEIIEGGDHVFSAKHPWKESELPSDLKKVVKLTTSFLD
ncbi:MAG: alpha/beta fold hydrolase [Bacteroidota bacterium]